MEKQKWQLYIADDEDIASKVLVFIVHLLKVDHYVFIEKSDNSILLTSNVEKCCSSQIAIPPCTLKRKQDESLVLGTPSSKAICLSKELCQRPFLKAEHGVDMPHITYAGLCTVARQLVKIASELHPKMNCKSLLGFKETCLKSHAEASIWTRFCEVEMIQDIKEVKSSLSSNAFLSQLPKAMKRLEYEFQTPKHLPNSSKYFGAGQEKWKKSLMKNSFNGIHYLNSQRQNCATDENPLIDDKSFTSGRSPYLCDFYLTLGDVILFAEICYFLSLCHEVIDQFASTCPLLTSWFQRLLARPDFQKALSNSPIPMVKVNRTSLSPCIPESNQLDEQKVKPVGKQITKQRSRGSYHAVDNKLRQVLQVTQGIGDFMTSVKEPLETKTMTWASLPPGVDPAEGELNPARAERKRFQIMNMLAAVELLAKPGDIIVDFCAGGGHVAIVVAYFLPKCQVILVENKEDSIARAVNRIQKLQLPNISVCQSNIDYFCGPFNIGIALHACGLATDLVLQLCLRQGASFVVCPCCYGGIKPIHDITYPRSNCFADNRVSAEDYKLLAHGADMVTWDFQSEKSQIGKRCMGLIDIDRSAQMRESGYQACVRVMRPEECSPKNHILVGSRS